MMMHMLLSRTISLDPSSPPFFPNPIVPRYYAEKRLGLLGQHMANPYLIYTLLPSSLLFFHVIHSFPGT